MEPDLLGGELLSGSPGCSKCSGANTEQAVIEYREGDLESDPEPLTVGRPLHTALEHIHNPDGTPFWAHLRQALDDHARTLAHESDQPRESPTLRDQPSAALANHDLPRWPTSDSHPASASSPHRRSGQLTLPVTRASGAV